MMNMGHQVDLLDDILLSTFDVNLTLDAFLTADDSVYIHYYYFRCHVATYHTYVAVHS